MKRIISLTIVLITIVLALKAQSAIIPQPFQESINTLKSFNMAAISSINYSCPTLEKEARYLSNQIKEKTELVIPVIQSNDYNQNTIFLSFDSMELSTINLLIIQFY